MPHGNKISQVHAMLILHIPDEHVLLYGKMQMMQPPSATNLITNVADGNNLAQHRSAWTAYVQQSHDLCIGAKQQLVCSPMSYTQYADLFTYCYISMQESGKFDCMVYTPCAVHAPFPPSPGQAETAPCHAPVPYAAAPLAAVQSGPQSQCCCSSRKCCCVCPWSHDHVQQPFTGLRLLASTSHSHSKTFAACS